MEFPRIIRTHSEPKHRHSTAEYIRDFYLMSEVKSLI